jgi:hypothetical protein
MLPEGDAAAATAGAAAGWEGWFFNIVPKADPDSGLRVVAGRSDLRRMTGAVYTGRVAVLNVGMT